MTKQTEQLIDRIDMIEKRVDVQLGTVKNIVDERVTSVLKIDRLVRGFKWNWLLVQIVTLLLVGQCSYQRGVDETIEWYEDEEAKESWEISNLLPIRLRMYGVLCSLQISPIHSQRDSCSMLV